MPKRKRLLWQLYPSYIVIMLVSLVVVTLVATASLRQLFIQQTEADLGARARLFESQILNKLNPQDPAGIDQLCKQIGVRVSTRFTVMLPDGSVIGDSHEDPKAMDNHRDRPEFIGAASSGYGTSMRHSLTLNQTMMYVALPLKRNDKTVALVRTSIPIDAIDEALSNVQAKIAIGGLIMALFSAILSFWVSRRISRPLGEMKEGAVRFARGDLVHRLAVHDTEEMGGLARALNMMAAQLDERIQTINRQRNEQEAVLSSMVEGVIAVDRDEGIISMNQAAGRMFDCDPTKVSGRSILEVARNTDLRDFVKKALYSQDLVEKDINHYTDQRQILNAHGTTLVDDKGQRIGALIVLEDVTRLRKLEVIRQDFVANVSHEIKTPTTAIKGFAETLGEGEVKDPEDVGRFTQIILNHADRLEAIVEDLLTLSRIEQDGAHGKNMLARHPIRDVLLSAIQVCEVKATLKKITLDLQCEDGLTAEINRDLLEQAVVNLLDNAIKYSPDGGEIKVTGGSTASEITIAVMDKGCGISAKHLNRIFERFYRVDPARSRALGGTGLGLAIVKHIVQAHKGRVMVKSHPGMGCTFSILLPRPLDDVP